MMSADAAIPMTHVVYHDAPTGVTAYLYYAGDPTLPAIGGCRVMLYPSVQDAARDAKRLAMTMYYKAKVHGLPLSGAKLVCMAEPDLLTRDTDVSMGFFQRLGAFVDSQQGRYIVAMDSGVTLASMDAIGVCTDYVCDGSRLGSPDAATARGVILSIEALVAQRLQKPLAETALAVMGVGAVGSRVVAHFRGKVAKLVVADTREAVLRLQCNGDDCEWVSPDQITEVACDVFVPCAVGDVVHAGNVDRLRCKIIAGAANNPLSDALSAADLTRRGVHYVPDYITNGGGLIDCAARYFKRPEWLRKIDAIPGLVG